MKYLIIMLLVCSTANAEGLYLSLGIGKNTELFSTDNNWDDGGGTGAFLAMYYQWDKQHWCFNCKPSINLVHLSQWNVGCPQDCNAKEDTIDHIGVTGTWKLF
jgi:hypothetical protein